MSDYYCPNCGADLGDQFGFSSSDGYWTCTECGQFLTDPEDSSDDDQIESVGWFCDECGAYLNKQFGFSCYLDTWTCTECGFENSLSEDEIYESEEDYQIHKNSLEISSFITDLFRSVITSNSDDDKYEDNEYEDEDDEYEDDEYEDDEYEDDEYEDEYINVDVNYQKSDNNKDNPYNKENLQEQQNIKHSQVNHTKRNTFFKRLWITIAHKKMIDVNVSLNECIGQNYLKVISLFEKSGFTNIRTNIIEDLKYTEMYKENIVSEVTIGGNNSFNIKSRAKYDADIIITYHKLRRVYPPLSFKEVKKRHGKDVIAQFKNAGFVNVTSNEFRDLTFGWLKKDGEVDYVTLAGERKYKSNILYRIDTPVVVAFHTFKKKR